MKSYFESCQDANIINTFVYFLKHNLCLYLHHNDFWRDLLAASSTVNVNVNVNMRFIVPSLLKEHGCIT